MIDLLIVGGSDVNYGNRLHSDWAAIHWAALTDNMQVCFYFEECNDDVIIDAGGRVCVEE